MEFNFEELYNLTLQQYKVTKEKCYVCHNPIEETELKLSCNHEYHHKCFNKIKDKKKCPYCEKRVIIQNKNSIDLKDSIKCQHTLKSNGLICGRINCKYHKNKEITIKNNNININDNICTTLIKSGLKKGQQCGRLNCKYHQINL
jgi:hypothetical protein